MKELGSLGNPGDNEGRILHLCGAMVDEDPGRERRGQALKGIADVTVCHGELLKDFKNANIMLIFSERKTLHQCGGWTQRETKMERRQWSQKII